MTSVDIAPLPQLLPARVNAPKHIKVTGKVRIAIEAMVWDGLPRSEAAKLANISEHGLYKALRKPPVRAFYLSELEVLRTSERARNIHRLVDIRDAADNMPAVNAIKLLEQIEDNSTSSGRGSPLQTQGFVIIVQSGDKQAPQIKTIEHESTPGADT